MSEIRKRTQSADNSDSDSESGKPAIWVGEEPVEIVDIEIVTKKARDGSQFEAWIPLVMFPEESHSEELSSGSSWPVEVHPGMLRAEGGLAALGRYLESEGFVPEGFFSI